MKIVHVIYSMEMGGAESLVAQLSRVQRAAGHDVSIFAQTNVGALGEVLQTEGFQVDVLGTGNPVRTLPTYLRAFQQLRPEVVHCHNAAPTLQAALAARLAGATSIVSTRHSLVAPPYNLREERLYGAVSRLCDHVVGICDATCANLRRAPWSDPRRISRVYNGIVPLTPVPAPDRPPKSGFTLLFVGRLAPVKNLSTLIRATAIAARDLPDLHLWIVGDGHERQSLEHLARDVAPPGTVTFWGEQHQVAPFYSAADVFTMSSTSEGLPVSLLQAMSIGLPALVTDVGGMAEVVRNTGAGLRTPVGDPDSMSPEILRLARDPHLRQTLGNAGKSAFAQHFTLSQMAETYMRLYRSRAPHPAAYTAEPPTPEAPNPKAKEDLAISR